MPPRQLALEERLQQRMSCDFQEMPLAEAVEYLREQLQINITLDAGIDLEQAPVTLSRKDVPARSILEWITRQTGLQYALADGNVCISSPQRALRSEPMYFKQHDVMDLTMPVSGAAQQPTGTGGTTMNANEQEALRQFLMECTGRQNWDENTTNGQPATQTQN